MDAIYKNINKRNNLSNNIRNKSKHGNITKVALSKGIATTPEEKIDRFFEKLEKKTDRFFTELGKISIEIVKALALLFSVAIILYVCASLAPGLRDEIPSVYKFVDAILEGMEWVYKVFLELVEWNYNFICQQYDNIIHLLG